MSCLPFIVWILVFFLVMGAADGLKVSSKVVDNPKLFGLSLSAFKAIKTFLFILFLWLSIRFELNLTYAIQMLLGIPLVFYFLHDGAYFYTRGQNECSDWNFTTSTNELYAPTISLSYSTRFILFSVGIIFYITSGLFMG